MELPFPAGAVHVTVTDWLPAVPATEVGAVGTPNGLTALELDVYEPVPLELIAATRNTYDVPLVNPVTVYDVDAEPVFAVA